LAYACPWLDEALQSTVAGDDAERALGAAQEQAEALVTYLETSAEAADPDQLLVCARFVDPDYPLVGPDR
jgi:hypothetical protein